MHSEMFSQRKWYFFCPLQQEGEHSRRAPDGSYMQLVELFAFGGGAFSNVYLCFCLHVLCFLCRVFPGPMLQSPPVRKPLLLSLSSERHMELFQNFTILDRNQFCFCGSPSWAVCMAHPLTSALRVLDPCRTEWRFPAPRLPPCPPPSRPATPDPLQKALTSPALLSIWPQLTEQYANSAHRYHALVVLFILVDISDVWLFGFFSTAGSQSSGMLPHCMHRIDTHAPRRTRCMQLHVLFTPIGRGPKAYSNYHSTEHAAK